MEKVIKPVKISRSNFNIYGDLISTNDIDPIDINAGYAKRFDNLANLNTSKDNGKTIVSIFSAIKRTFPMKIDMMEKHPLGSQAFIPMKKTTFICLWKFRIAFAMLMLQSRNKSDHIHKRNKGRRGYCTCCHTLIF